MISFILSLICLSGWPAAAAEQPAHDFHLSRTTLRYLPERDQLQVEMHVFLDDLELALAEAGAPNLRIGTEREDSATARYLDAYLDRHFKIFWGEEELNRALFGYELSDDLQALWIYLLAEPTELPDRLAVRQSILTEIYDDQRNLVQVDLGQAGGFNLLLDAGKIRAEREL